MKFELQLFLGLVIFGLAVKKYTWKVQFFLMLLVIAWIGLNYFKPKL